MSQTLPMIHHVTASEPWWIAIIEAGIIINLLLGLFAYLTLIERSGTAARTGF